VTEVPDQVLDAELSDALRARGQRVTLPRLLVHREVRRSPQHVTAEQVHSTLAAALPSLSPATIYATLDVLEELGLVRRVSTPGGATVFDSRAEAHHHAICRSCGAIADVDADVQADPALAAASRAGFSVDHAEVMLSGLCAACAGRG
jgi:Fe2+ or Zn2+ uptake regulation protein